MTSIIIPAHNEARTIGRLLDRLLRDARADEFEVIVVCNGCTDETAQVARLRRGVRVAELTEASKHLALEVGDRESHGFPRLYLDADVVVDTASARALVERLQGEGTLAVAPERDLVLDRSTWAVRAYYRAWERLPAVRSGLFGRGAVGVSEAGFLRIGERPHVMGDDLFLHSQFAPDERHVVGESISTVHAPRTLADLVRRRTRAAQGNAQLGRLAEGQTVTTASSSSAILRLALREPALWPSIAVFVAVTAIARRNAQRTRRLGESIEWLRDESSRT